MDTFHYVRLYTGPDGLSHFEDVEVPLTVGGTQGTSMLSELLNVSGLRFRLNKPDYHLDYHPAPRRQFIVNLVGLVDIEASDGEVRRFGPGSIMLAEDTTGKGHISRAIGGEARQSLFIYYPED